MLEPGPLLDSHELRERLDASPSGHISTTVLLWGWRAPSLEARWGLSRLDFCEVTALLLLEADLSIRPRNCNV